MLLDRYVPELLRARWHRQGAVRPQLRAEQSQCGLLLADISGFSELTRRMSLVGPEGLELLTAVVNDYFGRLIALIEAHGGDVVGFAGDAVLAIWPADPDNPQPAEVARRAAQAGLAIARRLERYEGAGGVELALKLRIGAGAGSLLEVGGVRGRWLHLIGGPAAEQLAQMTGPVDSGDVWLSPEAWLLVGPHARGTLRATGEVVLETILDPVPLKAAHHTELSETMRQEGAGYVPRVARRALGTTMDRWLIELRPVTCMLVGLPAAPSEDGEALLRFNDTVRGVMDEVVRFEGDVNKVAVDEKGCFLVAVWGLPGLGHTDDPDRAVLAALRASAALRGHGASVSIGVASGPVYCGVIGGESRREYTMLGGPVNRAARLMSVAMEAVLCDEFTRAQLRGSIRGRLLPAVDVPGIGSAFAADELDLSTATDAALLAPLVARTGELDLIDAALKTNQGPVWVQGEAGVGKTRLVAEVAARFHAGGGHVHWDGADGLRAASPYHAVRRLAVELVGAPSGASLTALRTRLDRLAAEEPALAGRLALLADVLSVPLPQNEFTAGLDGTLRAENLRQLMCKLLELRQKRGPTLVVLDDLHWADSASLGVASRLVKACPEVRFLLVARPLQNGSISALIELAELPTATAVILSGLERAGVRQLVSARLGATSLEGDVVDLIQHTTAGSPLMIEELTRELAALGHLIVADGVGRLAPGAAGAMGRAVPATVQGLVCARVDRLDPESRVFLKVASVVGLRFDRASIQHAWPHDAPKKDLADLARQLVDRGILARDPSRVDVWQFRHVLVRTALYDRMLFAQRRELHGAVARGLLQGASEPDPAGAPLVSVHLLKAEQWRPAVLHMSQAAEYALAHAANDECVELVRRTLAICEEHGVVLPSADRGRLQACGAEAWFRLGRMEEAADASFEALRAYGDPLPTGQMGLTAALLMDSAALLWRGRSGVVPERPTEGSGMPPEVRRQVVHLLSRLGDHYIYIAQPLGLLASTVRSLRRARTLGPCMVFARSLCTAALMIGVAGARERSRAWGDAAVAIAVGTAAAADDRPATGMDPESRAAAERSYVLARASVPHITVAAWPQAEHLLFSAVRLAHTYGDTRALVESLSLLANARAFQGFYGDTELLYRAFHAPARRRADLQGTRWSEAGQGVALLRMGRADEAAPLLKVFDEEAVEAAATDPQQVHFLAMLALCAVRLDRPELATRLADAAAGAMRGGRPVAYFLAESAAALVETRLLLFGSSETAAGSGPKRADATLVGAAVEAMGIYHGYAKVFPFCVPHAAVLDAWLAELTSARNVGRRLERARSAVAGAHNPFLEATMLARMPRPDRQRVAAIEARLNSVSPAVEALVAEVTSEA